MKEIKDYINMELISLKAKFREFSSKKEVENNVCKYNRTILNALTILRNIGDKAFLNERGNW